MKKKSSGINSEEQALDYITKMFQNMQEKRNDISGAQILRSIPKKHRSLKAIKYVIPRFSNVKDIIELIPFDLLKKEEINEILTLIVLRDPSVLKPVDIFGQISRVKIEKEMITTPVSVAMELRMRLRRVIINYNYGYGNPNMKRQLRINNSSESFSEITDIAEAYMIKNNLYEAFNVTNSLEQRAEYMQELCDKIIEVSKMVESEKTISSSNTKTKYECKYSSKNVKYNSKGQKLAILITGVPNTGKTTLARKLHTIIPEAKCFDSDYLIEHHKIFPSDIITPKDNVVIYSDPSLLSDDNIDVKNIKSAMGNPNILTIYIKPSDIKRMSRNTKSIFQPDIDKLQAEVNSYNIYESIADLTVINDYTDESLNIACDKIIDYIIKKYKGLILKTKFDRRKTLKEFAIEINPDRINEGAERTISRGLLMKLREQSRE